MITQILYTPLYTLYIHYIYTSVYTCFLPAEGYLESWRGGLWGIVGYYWGIVVYYWELVGYYLWRGASPLETGTLPGVKLGFSPGKVELYSG